MSISIENLQITTRIVDYAVSYTSGHDGRRIVAKQDNLPTAIRNAAKLDGRVVEQVSFVTDWEPYLGCETVADGD